MIMLSYIYIVSGTEYEWDGEKFILEKKKECMGKL